MTSLTATLTEDLAKTRAALRRLQQRASELDAALALHSAAAAPQPRPGWPIRRLVTEPTGISLH
jgi:hypothetical protein